MDRLWVIAIAMLAGSLMLSAVFWYLGIPFFIAFLFIPFIPILSRKRRVKHCPVCGWETTGSERFCPFDATPLRETGSEG